MNSGQRQVRSALRQIAAATPSGVLRSSEETKVLRAVRTMGVMAGELVKVVKGMERQPEAVERALSETQKP